MTRYLLNSAVLTDAGTYRYRLLTREQAVAWLQRRGWVSQIGYTATAEHIRAIAGCTPALNREARHMAAGDEALVVRLTYRVADPANKRSHQPGPEDWEYGLLAKLSDDDEGDDDQKEQKDDQREQKE